jgi:hypothetical protein
MDINKGLLQREFTEFLEELYILGQETNGIGTKDFIKIIEEKLHSLIKHQGINN